MQGYWSEKAGPAAQPTESRAACGQRRLPRPQDTADAFFVVSKKLLDGFDHPGPHPGPFRLVGMAAFDLDWRQRPQQSDLSKTTASAPWRRPSMVLPTASARASSCGQAILATEVLFRTTG